MSDPGINGILNISKEAGYTSFDVVAVARGVYRQRKCGHTGTLDPMATGVLPVAFGKATKVCGMITDWDKEYIAELLLGRTTDTLDVTGDVTGGNETAAASLNIGDIEDAVMSFLGESDQMPPMYSALKVDGRRLYDIARSGESVERKTRKINIRRIEILDISLPVVKFKVLCSKGTYIRSLCDDIGAKLNCGGCMQSLVRSMVGPFLISDAVYLSDIKKLRDEGNEEGLKDLLVPVDKVFSDLPAVTVRDTSEKLLLNGNKLQTGDLAGDAAFDTKQKVRVYHSNDSFAAVYDFDPKTGMFKPDKMF